MNYFFPSICFQLDESWNEQSDTPGGQNVWVSCLKSISLRYRLLFQIVCRTKNKSNSRRERVTINVREGSESCRSWTIFELGGFSRTLEDTVVLFERFLRPCIRYRCCRKKLMCHRQMTSRTVPSRTRFTSLAIETKFI